MLCNYESFHSYAFRELSWSFYCICECTEKILRGQIIKSVSDWIERNKKNYQTYQAWKWFWEKWLFEKLSEKLSAKAFIKHLPKSLSPNHLWTLCDKKLIVKNSSFIRLEEATYYQLKNCVSMRRKRMIKSVCG